MSNNNTIDENERVLEALERLQISLKELPDKQNAPHFSHWRVPPEAVTTAYDYMEKGTELVKATSTKYTLVGKIDSTEGSKLAKELLKGCEYISTGALVLCNDDTGCAHSTRHFANQAARAVVSTTIALVQIFREHHEHDSENIAAQKTGAVWSTCDALLKIPRGNRNAIRREVFTFIMECNETMQEFTNLIQRGVKSSAPLNTIQESDEKEEASSWDDFLDRDDDLYMELELPVATASLCLIKCSRGSLNVTLQACESIGSVMAENNNGSNDGEHDKNVVLLDWIQKLTTLARNVGNGMTDLGTCLYPPLHLNSNDNDNDSLLHQLNMQRGAIVALTECILDTPTELPQDVTELASKLKNAATTRYKEATDAIDAALNGEM